MTPDHTSAAATFTWQAEWGLLLRMTRQVAGMTLAELSARSGISKGYLSKLESGHPSARNPSRATLAGLERALPGLAPLAHMLGPDPAGPIVTLEPHSADLPPSTASGQPALLRLGWRELEVVGACLVLVSAAVPAPITLPLLAHAVRRSVAEIEPVTGRLTEMALLTRRPPTHAGAPATYRLGAEFTERTGIHGLSDVLVLGAALLMQRSARTPGARTVAGASWAPADDLA